MIAAGCAGSPAGLAPPTASEPATVAADTPEWHSLSHDQRKQYMQQFVLPTMEPLFAAHDGERFASFGCRTCHGSAARERGYAMPNPELPILYPTGSAEQKATVERHRETARFMHQKVTPNMRRLLGIATYEPSTGKGFSCFHCHPRGEPAQPPAALGGPT